MSDGTMRRKKKKQRIITTLTTYIPRGKKGNKGALQQLVYRRTSTVGKSKETEDGKKKKEHNQYTLESGSKKKPFGLHKAKRKTKKEFLNGI